MSGLELMICPSCSKDLGSLELVYIFLTKLKKKWALKKFTKLDTRSYDTTSDITDFEDILNFLNLNKLCCRTHKLTSAKMRDLYHIFSRPS